MTTHLLTPLRRRSPEFNPLTKGDHFRTSDVRWVTDKSGLDLLVRAIHRAEVIVPDLETTGLNEHAIEPVGARIVLASITLPEPGCGMYPTTYVLPLSHPDSPLRGVWRKAMTRVAVEMRNAGKPLVNQNIKFDLRWIFAHTQVDLSHLLAWDTQVSSHLFDENTTTKLKVVASKAFGIPRWDDYDLSTPGAAERVPMFDLGLYAARDTYWDWRLFLRHLWMMGLMEGCEPPLDPDSQEAYRLGRLAVYCSMPTTAAITAMEQRGMGVDVGWVKKQVVEDEGTRDETYEALVNAYPDKVEGEPSFAPTSNWFRDWTEAAVEAGDLRVAALTPKGRPQWSKGVLLRQARSGSTLAETLLKHRGSVKRLEFLRAWLAVTTPLGNVHATYHVGRNYDTNQEGGTVTGRLSASNPNLQQVAKGLRPAFVPRPGMVIADLDYSQIELRVAAFLSRSETMIAAYQQGLDLHRLLASRITGKPLDEVSDEERQQAKATNFGFLYGMGVKGFVEYAETVYGVTFSEAAAAEFQQAFFDQWGLRDWHTRCIREARAFGKVVSPLGRVRRIPDIWDPVPYLSSAAERIAINAPVQGFASDLMQIATASISGLYPGVPAVKGVWPIATVHDSIVVEVERLGWEERVRECMGRMVDIPTMLRPMRCDFDVPLAVEAKIGTRWSLSDVGAL